MRGTAVDHEFSFLSENGEFLTARFPVGNESYDVVFYHDGHPNQSWEMTLNGLDCDPKCQWDLTESEQAFVNAVLLVVEAAKSAY